MSLVFAVIVGLLYSAAFYMILRRSLVKLLIGLVLLGHASNLLIFAAAGLTRHRPPLVTEGQVAPLPPVADPVAQALVLTAIVISFGVLAFTVVLSYRFLQDARTDDLDELQG